MAEYIDLKKMPCRECEKHFECVQFGCNLYNEWLNSGKCICVGSHGHWIDAHYGYSTLWQCSVCKNVTGASQAHKLYKYCPQCGAMLDEHIEWHNEEKA